MKRLIKLSDPVTVQILCDALNEQHISFRVDNSGMHALLPLPVVMDMQIMVNQNDLKMARQILHDLGMDT